MKKKLLFILLLASFTSYEALSQCGQVSLIGEFNTWSGDHFMTRNPENPAQFTTILVLTAADDTELGDGIVNLKFRENADWAVNWGATDFPSGVGTQGGPNIPVPVGSYLVTFDCSTGAYNFQTTCGEIGMIGEFNTWSGDQFMTRDAANPNKWTGVVFFDAGDDTELGDGIVNMKFRENSDWNVNWGSPDFPNGIGLQGGPNIPVPLGGWFVNFDCGTGEYSFTSTCGEIALIGEFNTWSDDFWMTRNPADPNEWSVILSLTTEDDTELGDGIVNLKFRQNSDWGVNWGATDFPNGIGVQGGPNIPVPLGTEGLSTDYHVTFNCATGAYSFHATSAQMNMIGEFNGWAADIPMYRDPANPDLWKITRAFPAIFDISPLDGKIEMKFRETNDWTTNWGGETFPSGTGVPGGTNIKADPGTYDVTFNYATLAYNFVANSTVCGEIGMIGDFNTWGDNGTGVPTDAWMIRDPMYPSQFSIEYNFSSTTNLWFRLNADPLYGDVWGGTFPSGTGVQGGEYIEVPGGKYIITFNCQSHDFNFLRLGNAITAPKVFTMVVDGILDESDWDISQNVAQVVDGTLSTDPNMIYFGAAYNDEYLFVGLNVADAVLKPGEEGEVFVDGNKSGGPYDDFDVHLKFSALGLEVIHGPEGIVPLLGFIPGAGGYTAELGIPWEALGVVPVEGAQIGIDIMIGDDDDDVIGPEYRMAWNGGLQNYEGTSSFGDLNFGVLACGHISLYNSTIGDVGLMNPTDEPTTYVGTYELFADQGVVFRKDMQGAVNWGDDTFPTGIAVVDGPEIPATTGRYRVTFDCLSGEFNFAEELAGEGVAYSEYTDTPPEIDGDLTEYNLQYASDKLVVGTGPVNNTVTWGSLWDGNNLYLAASVVDAVVEGIGNPWDNDAIEFYIDGNHDSDGPVDSDFDTQLIMDALMEGDTAYLLWLKADGVQLTDFDAMLVLTGSGYDIELRLGWAGFSFLPGKGRSIGFSLSNNDSDLGLGRDYQTTWFGTENNWSNMADLGDLQLNGGPYFFGVDENPDLDAFVVLYPNPSRGNVYLQLADEVFKGDVRILVSDMSGRTISSEKANFNNSGNILMIDASRFTPGIYFINLLGENGQRAVKKLIVQ